jgi:predicted aspartyl protease
MALRLISPISGSLLLVVLGLFFQNAPLLAESPVGFELVNGQFVVVSVLINNTGAYDFMLDTGSNVTLVDPQLISRLDAVSLGNKQLETPAGSRSVSCYRIDKFQLGPTVVRSLEVIALPVTSLKGRRVSGLLGQDFLGKFNYVLDYKNKVLRFEENQELEEHLSSRIFNTYRYAKRVLVMLPPQSSRSRPSLFVIDSGAQHLVLFGHKQDGLGFDLKFGYQTGNLNSVVGNQTGLTSRIGFFSIGDTGLTDLPVVITAEAPKSKSFRLENGLLPASYFQSIYFNNLKNYVSFNPRFASENSRLVK